MFNIFKLYGTSLFPDVTIFNSESRTNEIFEPLSKDDVKIYTCGPTVYDYAHIGNLRAYVFSDTLKRMLIYNGYTVNHTINLTDFGHLTSDSDTGDDKMMKGLRRENMEISLESMRRLSDTYIQYFKNDLMSLNVLNPTQFARASDYVPQQIVLIKTLEEKGYTYQTSDGLYFDISKFPSYGRLGNIDIDALCEGSRIEKNPEKKHPADFAVWKKGNLGWDSAWGKGFPGWHIECSAMAFVTLGKQIDIHTGGIDNMPIHHNGEIAQCEAATSKTFSKYWMHNEHIQINNQKISKSDNTGITMQSLINKGYSGDDYRYWLLQSHYRTKTNFSYQALEASQKALARLKRLVFIKYKDARGKLNSNKQLEIVSAINNDLDTPKVIALMHNFIKDKSLKDGEKKALILECDSLLGIGLTDNLQKGLSSIGQMADNKIPKKIQELIQQRKDARAEQNWTEADQLRDVIFHAGYTLEDSSEGTQITKSNQ